MEPTADGARSGERGRENPGGRTGSNHRHKPKYPEFYVFLNERYVPQTEVEGFSLQVEAPDNPNEAPTVRATLAQIVTNVAGQRTTQRLELFPGTLEIIALGRRISVTCTRLNSLDGLWISLGLLPDGTGKDIEGAKSLNLLMEGGLLSARLVWQDGAAEDLLAQ